MAIALRKPAEIEALRVSNQLVAQTLNYLSENVKVGMSLNQINKMGEDFIYAQNATPAFKGLYGFPAGVCTSLNQVVIHGAPNNTKIKNGDILGLDIGVEKNGWYGDAAITIPIGEISEKNQDLIDCSRDALYHSISMLKIGMRFKELSQILEIFIRQRGYYPLFGFCGHGIGRKPHEDPEIPNYLQGKAKQGPKIKNGMVFCIEPMICQTTDKAIILEDNWSVVCEDRLNTSHYEHTVAMIDGKAEILSRV